MGVAIALIAGSIAGVASAHWAIDRASVTAIGPWRSWTGGGPYTAAHYLLSGRLPPARGLDLVFEASSDSQGERLDGDCDYTLTGRRIGARWWRIAAPAGGSAVTSTRAIGEPDGSIRISLSREPRPGNWMRPGTSGSFTLQLTLKSESSRRTSAAVIELPQIARGGCR